MHRSLLLFTCLCAILTMTLASFAIDLNIKDFGAICDGVTDDVQAVIKAIEACPDGGTIIIPGMTAIGQPGMLVLGKRDVTIKGVNGGGFKALSDTDLTCHGLGTGLLLLRFCTNCTVQDLEFNVNNMPVSGVGFDRSDSCTAQNLYIHDVGIGPKVSGGLVSCGSRHNRYLKITVKNTAHSDTDGVRGMWLGNWWDTAIEWYPTVSECYITNAGATGLASHAAGARFADNTFENNMGAGTKLVTPPVKITTATSIIENNHCIGNLFNGIQIDDPHDMIIRDNLLKESGGPGIYVISKNEPDKSAQRIIITGNVICNNKSAASTAGIWMHGGSDIEITNNIIEDTRTGKDREQLSGIALAPMFEEFKNVKITGNRISNHRWNGISLWSGPFGYTDIEITNNIIENNTNFGVNLESFATHFDKLKMFGNTYRNNGLGANNLGETGGISLAPPMVKETVPPAIAWEKVPDAFYYTVQVAADAAFTKDLATYTVADTDFTLPNLKADATYFWRVLGVREKDKALGVWSEVKSFTVK